MTIIKFAMDQSAEEFKTWVAKLIDNHQEATVHLPLTRSKLLAVSPNDTGEFLSRIACLKDNIDTKRAELEMSRTIGEWQPDVNLLKIVSASGTKVHSFGFQNAAGKFLSPFEALFLFETNRLQILEDDIPWTISKAYQTLLLTNNDVVQYKGYRKFAIGGHNMKNPISNFEEHKSKKLKTTHLKSCPFKTSGNKQNEGIEDETLSAKTFKDIFKELKASGPQANAFNLAQQKSQIETIITSEEISAKLLQGEKKCLCFTRGESAMIRIEHIQIPDIHPLENH